MFELLTTSIPAFIVLLGVLVFVHEAGHFVVGRACGIAAETFSIGFGPKIFGFRLWGTDFRVSWIPLGGYVKFVGAFPGEDISDDLKAQSFTSAPLYRRALTVAAGPVANLLLAVVVYSILSLQGIPRNPAMIGEVMPGSPGEIAGLRYDDLVVEIDSQPVDDWSDIQELISKRPGKAFPIVVERDSERVTMTLQPEVKKVKDFLGRGVEIGRAGIALQRVPSSIAVIQEGSRAAKIGLATGEKIVGLVDEAGKTTEILYLPQLKRVLRQEIASGATKVTFVVGKAAAEEAVPTRLVEVPLDQLETSDPLQALGIHNSQLVISDVEDHARGVLQDGDYIVGFEGEKVRNFYDLHEQAQEFPRPKAQLSVVRDFKTLNVDVPLVGEDIQKPEGRVTIYTLPFGFLGQPIPPEPIYEKAGSLAAAVGFGFYETGRQSVWLLGIIKHLLTGDIPLKVLGGPISIAKQASDSVKRGWETFLVSMALISINLGLINLFPIPVLDGGQLLLLSAEAIRRRPLKEAAVENFQKLGFAMILALVVLSTYNDLSRYWKSMLEALVGEF